MRTVLFCLVLSANALPEAHLRGRNRDRDLSVPEDAKSRLLGLASNEKPSVALAHDVVVHREIGAMVVVPNIFTS